MREAARAGPPPGPDLGTVLSTCASAHAPDAQKFQEVRATFLRRKGGPSPSTRAPELGAGMTAALRKT